MPFMFRQLREDIASVFERDPAAARKHLVEADGLVDAVRKELTRILSAADHELDGGRL